MIEERLAELGITLPEPPKAVGSYLPALASGRLLYISGQLPLREGAILARGPVGEACTAEQAREAARQCVLNMLAVARRHAGSLDAISRVVQMQGYVHTPPGNPALCVPTLNAASDLLVEILGERGRHTRAAVCAAGLPLEAALELVVVLELEPV
ncbi:MAG: RidA family protein [Opitutales bacterium]|jgi:enamine deaminase RidA (YjgF/YER057c/UK114 family)